MSEFVTENRRHRFNHLPDPITGVDVVTIVIPADAYFLSAVTVETTENRGHLGALGLPSIGAMGEQTIIVPWTLLPVPGSFVEYRLRVQFQALETSFGRAILFEHVGFNGKYKMIENSIASLVDDGWNDLVSSVVVLSGAWVFYKDIDFQAPYTRGRSNLIILETGMYPWIEDQNIKNDDMSSLRSIRKRT